MEEEWEIEAILKKRFRKEKSVINGYPSVLEYYVKWKGYDNEYNEWKTEEELYDLVSADYEERIVEFERREKEKEKEKEKKTKPKKNDKTQRWNEAEENQRINQQREFRQAKERAKIEWQLMEEAELDENNLREEEFAKQLEEQARRREIIEKKRFTALKLIYAPLQQEEEVAKQENTKPKKKPRERSRVPTLWNICLDFICENITLYDGWEGVPIILKAKLFHSLSMRKMLSDEKFENLLDPLQKYLDLSLCRQSVTQNFFVSLQKSPFLTTLTLTDCTTLYFTWIKSLQACPNLENINFSGSYHLASLEGLEHCKKLKTLLLKNCFRLCSGNPNAVEALKQLTNLEVLDITGAYEIPLVTILGLFQSLPELQRFYGNDAGQYISTQHKNELNPKLSYHCYSYPKNNTPPATTTITATPASTTIPPSPPPYLIQPIVSKKLTTLHWHNFTEIRLECHKINRYHVVLRRILGIPQPRHKKATTTTATDPTAADASPAPATTSAPPASATSSGQVAQPEPGTSDGERSCRGCGEGGSDSDGAVVLAIPAVPEVIFPRLVDVAFSWTIPGRFSIEEVVSLYPGIQALSTKVCVKPSKADKISNLKISSMRTLFTTPLPHLTSLDLDFQSFHYRFPYITRPSYEVTTTLANLNLPLLTTLKLSFYEHANVVPFLMVWRNQHFSSHLNDLDLSFWGRAKSKNGWLTPAHIDFNTLVLAYHPALTRVNLAGCMWIDKMEILSTFVSPKVVPNLEYLNLLGLNLFKDNTTLRYLLSSFPSLTTLAIGSGTLLPSCFTDLPAVEHLHELVVKFSTQEMVTQDWGMFFDNFPRLKKLKISTWRWGNRVWLSVPDFWKALRRVKTLKQLWIMRVALNSKHLPLIEACSQLYTVTVTCDVTPLLRSQKCNIQFLRDTESEYNLW